MNGQESSGNKLTGTNGRERSDERRQTARYELRGVASFRWRSADGNWHEGNGTTVNIGSGGALIASKSLPRIASQLSVTVTIPVTWTSESEVRLSGYGDVRHVTSNEVEESGYGAFVLFRTEVGRGTA